MTKQEKNMKAGFVIKLSTETVQKLSEEDEKTKTPLLIAPVKADKPLENTSEPCQDTLKEVSQDNSVVKKDIPNNQKNTESIKKKVESSPNIENNLKPPKALEPSGSKDVSNSWGDYAPYVTYEDDVAIYTDPTTQQKYTWCSATNTWVKKQNGDGDNSGKVYSYEDETHIYTDSDGSKFFWDIEKKAWIPKVDDDFLAYYQMSYGFVDNESKDGTPKDNTGAKDESNKTAATEKTAGVKRKVEPQWFDATDDNNTKVYVSNLPLEMTEEEFVDLMQKYGLVMRDPSSQKMKIKLYMDKEQNCFKGDALCTYIKIESVELALKLLDGSDYKGNKIKVEKAHFQLKGEYNPALKPKKKKKKELEKIKRMQEKLFDWRPEKILGERAKHERIVIIKNLFHPTDFDKEVQLILDYQQDLREEALKCGEVRKVVIYDSHPEGVAQITMKEPEEADAVVSLMNDRWFGKRKLSAEIWDGRTKYRIAETDAEINKRMDKWGRFLEGKDDEVKATAKQDSTNVEEVKGNQGDDNTKPTCDTITVTDET